MRPPDPAALAKQHRAVWPGARREGWEWGHEVGRWPGAWAGAEAQGAVAVGSLCVVWFALQNEAGPCGKGAAGGSEQSRSRCLLSEEEAWSRACGPALGSCRSLGTAAQSSCAPRSRKHALQGTHTEYSLPAHWSHPYSVPGVLSSSPAGKPLPDQVIPGTVEKWGPKVRPGMKS